MALQIKVQGETPKSGRSICHTCKHASVVIGQNCEEFIHCSAVFHGPVTFKVARCSEYHPTNMPWKHEMEDMAWKIEARRRCPSGFQPEPGESEMEVTVEAPRRNGGAPECG